MITGARNLDLLIRLRNGCKNRALQCRKTNEFIFPENYSQMSERACKNVLKTYKLTPDDYCIIAQNILTASEDVFGKVFKSRF